MSESKEQIIEDSYDAVIIGAGNGGLIAAAELAMRGVNILLLEQHNLPGGFASSFVRGRFEFETSLHELYDWGPESNKGGTRRLLERFELDSEFLAVPEAYRLIVTDPDENLDVVMPFGIDAYLDAIEKAVPGCRDSVSKFFNSLCTSSSFFPSSILRCKSFSSLNFAFINRVALCMFFFFSCIT